MKKKPPKALDLIADVVLAYRPKPKSKPARRRKCRANKMAKEYIARFNKLPEIVARAEERGELRATAFPQWRSITTAPRYELVLVYDPRFNGVHLAHLDGNGDWRGELAPNTLLKPTKWVPLPLPPPLTQ